jgi:hypothetical protein
MDKPRDLVVDLSNKFNTDELIVKSIVQQVNAKPTSWNIQPLAYKPDYFRGRPNSLYIQSQESAKQTISRIAFQNGKLIQGNGNYFEMVDMIYGKGAVYTFDENNILAQTVELAVAGEPATVFNIDFRGHKQLVKKHNYYYGEKAIGWAFDAYDCNIWRIIRFKATFEALAVQTHDIVQFNFTQGLHYQPVYEQVTGPIDTPVIYIPTDTEGVFITEPAPMPLYNCKGLVTNSKFNVEEGTIEFQVWLPIIAGETSQNPSLWKTIL